MGYRAPYGANNLTIISMSENKQAGRDFSSSHHTICQALYSICSASSQSVTIRAIHHGSHLFLSRHISCSAAYLENDRDSKDQHCNVEPSNALFKLQCSACSGDLSAAGCFSSNEVQLLFREHFRTFYCSLEFFM